MRLFAMYLLAALAVSSVSAALYQKTDHTIVDPGTTLNGNAHKSAGNNLAPDAYLTAPTLPSNRLNFHSK